MSDELKGRVGAQDAPEAARTAYREALEWVARTRDAVISGRDDEARLCAAESKKCAETAKSLLPPDGIARPLRGDWERYGLQGGGERKELGEEEAPALVTEAEQWALIMDRYERSWVRAYTLHGERINRHLISGKSLEEPVEGSRVPAREGFALLDSALAKAASPDKPHLTYRGYCPPLEVRKADDVVGWARKNFRVGEKYSSPSYLSVSHCPGRASNFADAKWSTPDGQEGEASHRFMFEIVSSRGAPVATYSKFQNHERERLLPRDSEFRIVGVHENVTVRGRQTVLVQLVDIGDERRSR